MFGKASNDYGTLDPTHNVAESYVRQVYLSYTHAATKLDEILRTVDKYEAELGIEVRWTPGSPEYKMILAELHLRDYRHSLDRLEYLVVQRMFELSKLSMSSVGKSHRFVIAFPLCLPPLGYKMRQKIGNALRAQLEAIKKALKEYNELAGNLNPPREQLTWTRVVEMATVGDFDLLRHARQDIRERPWAQASTCEAMRTYLNLQRAEEERTRLNVEMNRLLTALLDTHVDISIAMEGCQDPSLFAELHKRFEYHQLVSEKIVSSLVSASRMPEFTGTLSVGRRIGCSSKPHDVPPPSWILGISLASPAMKDGEAETTDTMDGLIDFFDAIEL